MNLVRDSILKPPVPQNIFICNIDVCCSFPFEQLIEAHSKHRGVATILGVNVSSPLIDIGRIADLEQVKRENATNYGCIVHDPSSAQVLHYVEKPESWISNMVNGGVYRESTSALTSNYADDISLR